MGKKTNIEKFKALVSEEKSTLLDKLKFRKENKQWLEISSTISFKVLSKLRSNKKQDLKPSTQKELAKSMGVTLKYVNKLVKGSENLSPNDLLEWYYSNHSDCYCWRYRYNMVVDITKTKRYFM